jgi:6,7-dimethyl-8-ribityllumazine synthase
MKTFEGNLSAGDLKIAIIVSKFNEFVGTRLLEGAIDCLKKHNCKDENIHIIKVPGAFEIPLAADRLAAEKNYDAVIALGAVIRGATPHFDYISSAVSTGCAQAALKHGIPIIFGVLTTNTVEQALERSDSKMGNKGWDSALTAIEMGNLLKQL